MLTDKIYNENCLLTMSRMSNDFVDLTVTSPPYDNLRTYNGFVFEFEEIAKELYRVTKQGGVIVWVVNDATVNGSETGTSFRQALYFKEIGFNLHDTMIWNKQQSSMPENNRYFNSFEYMFIFAKGKPRTFNPIEDRKNKSFGRKITGTNLTPDRQSRVKSNFGKPIKEYGIRYNIWEQYPQMGRNIKHPAPFPEQLVNDHIITWSNPNDLVYDPFMGSGTTAKMALINNRHFVGSEISKEYCDTAERRIYEISAKLCS